MPTETNDQIFTGELSTIDSWKGAAEEMLFYHGDTGYLMALEQFVPVLENMLNNASSLRSLKKQMQRLVDERKEFIDFAKKNLP